MTQQLEELLKQAMGAVNSSGIDEDVRPIAFQKAFEYLTIGDHGQNPRTSLAGGTSAALKSEDGNRASVPDGLIGRIATRLNLDLTVVSEVYSETETGDLNFHLQVGSLSNTRAQASQEIALIVSAGRQASGIEEWTDYSLIREICDYYSKLDTNNFASTLQDDEMQRQVKITGTGRGKKVQLRAVGWEAAAKLVEKFGGIGD